MFFLYKIKFCLICYRMMFSLYNIYFYIINEILIYLYLYVFVIVFFNLEISNFY